MRTVLLLIAGLAAACSELATPAELSRPQIIGVRADPPAVEPGGSARLSVLVAGPDGAIEPAAVHWDGPVRQDADGVTWFDAPPSPATVKLGLVVELDDGTTLPAIKTIAVSAGAAGAANPEVGPVTVDGAAPTSAPTATTVELTVDAGSATQVSWFVTGGSIALYRRTPTAWDTPDEPADVTGFVVCRDGRGGTSWRSFTVAVVAP